MKQTSSVWMKDCLHFKYESGQFSGLPTELPLLKHLKVVGCPLSCHLSCPPFPYMDVIKSLICMAKFLLAANDQSIPLPTELPTFSYLEIVGRLLSYPLSCPLFPYVAKFPRAAHSVAHVQHIGNEVGSFSCFIFPACVMIKVEYIIIP